MNDIGEAQRDFFYGANFEFSYNSAVFSPTRFGVELRPIVGVRNADFEFIVNPIVDFAAGHYGFTNFAPAVRLGARAIGMGLPSNSGPRKGIELARVKRP